MAQNAPVNAPSYRTDDTYYWDFVTFLVEDTLFRVPRYNFLAKSRSFASQHGIDRDGINTPGLVSVSALTPVNLVKLDVAANDFRPFLKALYPMTPFSKSEVEVSGTKKTVPVQVGPSLSEAEWLSVLKLTTCWRFNDLRSMAVDALSATDMNEVTKANLAKEYDVDEWLVSAYTGLIQRSETISTNEAERLGWRDAITLFQIREVNKANPKWSPTALRNKILESFPDEFNRIQKAQPQYVMVEKTKSSLEGVTGTIGSRTNPIIKASNTTAASNFFSSTQSLSSLPAPSPARSFFRPPATPATTTGFSFGVPR